MLHALRQAAAIAFYVLGASFFVAAVLLRNTVGGNVPAWWMQVADLPLALSALLYAGLSLYESVRPGQGHSRMIAVAVTAPLAAFFVLLLALNFWPR
ncbi:MAG: hypothetical protein WCV62_04690 [Candidatus Peribacteraceae bacterium]|jgi:hypothetical protein